MFHARVHMVGSGKSYLCELIKFDNLTGDLVAHKSQCTALTSGYMSGRILGVSKTATVSSVLRNRYQGRCHVRSIRANSDMYYNIFVVCRALGR